MSFNNIMKGFGFGVKMWEQRNPSMGNMLFVRGFGWGVGSLVNTKFMVNAKGDDWGGVDTCFDLNGGSYRMGIYC